MISYEALLRRMEDTFASLSGCSPEAAGDTDLRFRVLAGEVYTLLARFERFRRNLDPDTAAGEALDALGAEYGVVRREAQRAQGVLTFSNAAATLASVTIPAGTVCKTPGEDGVRFHTLEEGVIPMNTVGSVSVKAEAESPGAAGNVAAGTVTVLVSSVPLVSAVTNAAAFSGGRAAEADEMYRKRLHAALAAPPVPPSAGFYRALLLREVDGVQSCAFLPKGADGRVEVYLGGAGAAAEESAVAAAQQVLDENAALNLSFLAKPAEAVAVPLSIAVTKQEGAEAAAVQAACETAVREWFLALSIGEALPAAGLIAALAAVPGVYDVLLESALPASPAPQQLWTLGELEIHVS